MKLNSNIESASIDAQESYLKEISDLKRLSDLYKRNFDDCSLRLSQWEQHHSLQSESFSQQLSKVHEQYKVRLEECQALYDTDRNALLEKIQSLEHEVSENKSRANVARIENDVNEDLLLSMKQMSPATLFQRIQHAELEKENEKTKRKELEVYLNQVLKDIETKAPAIAKLRKDYFRIVENHSQLSNELDRVIEESSTLAAEKRDVENKYENLCGDYHMLESHNRDLSKQIRFILEKNQAEENANEVNDIVSTNLVTYSNVEELQAKNEQLLQLVRKMCYEEEHKVKADSACKEIDDSSAVAVNSTLEELQELRETRKKAQDMVTVLKQQRDMYRCMLDEIKVTGTIDTLNDRDKLDGSLMKKVELLEEEKKRLTDRLLRYEESESILHESIGQLRAEASSARKEAVISSNDCKFLKERIEKLETSLKLSQQENAASLQRRVDLEKTLVDFQQQLRVKDEEISNGKLDLRKSSETISKLQVDIEVFKLSEQRLTEQLKQTREEISRQSNLTECIHRIEVSLQSKAEEEKARLQQENNELKRAVDHMKLQQDERVVGTEQKLQKLEDQLREELLKVHSAESETCSLRERLSQEQSVSKAAHDRASILEKQLLSLQEKVSSIEGCHIIETVAEKELAEKEMELSRLTVELDSLRSRWKTAEAHSEEFRNLLISSENTLKEYKSQADDKVKLLQDQLNVTKAQVDTGRLEAEEHRVSYQSLLEELEAVKSDYKLKESEHSVALRLSKEEFETVRAENISLNSRIVSLLEDIQKLQTSASAAYENYERELQLHAKSERELREEKKNVTLLTKKLDEYEIRFAELSAECFKLERKLSEEQQKTAEEVSHYKEDLRVLQQTNDLLHSNLQSIGSQVEKIHSSNLSINEEHQFVSESLNGSEVTLLRKSCSELREVLKFMKADKDMLEARLSISEAENNRHQNQTQSLLKTIDQLRLELKSEIDQKSKVRSEEEFQRIVAEVTQLNIVRESNAHLRSENEELVKRVQQLSHELMIEKAKLDPLQDSVRRLSAEKESLELVNDQLTNDVSYWRNRLQTLVSRYNEIDPEEHNQLKLKFNEVREKLEEHQKLLVEKEKSFKEDLAVKHKEFVSAKATAEGAEKNATILRDKLRLFKEKNTDLDSKLKEMAKVNASREAAEHQLSEAQVKITELTLQINELNSKLISVVAVPQEASIASASTTEVTKAKPAKVPRKRERTEEQIASSVGGDDADHTLVTENKPGEVSEKVAPTAENPKMTKLKMALLRRKAQIPAKEADGNENIDASVTESEHQNKKAKMAEEVSEVDNTQETVVMTQTAVVDDSSSVRVDDTSAGPTEPEMILVNMVTEEKVDTSTSVSKEEDLPRPFFGIQPSFGSYSSNVSMNSKSFAFSGGSLWGSVGNTNTSLPSFGSPSAVVPVSLFSKGKQGVAPVESSSVTIENSPQIESSPEVKTDVTTSSPAHENELSVEGNDATQNLGKVRELVCLL